MAECPAVNDGMGCAGEDQISFALLDSALNSFPGHLECQQMLADIDEKLKENTQCIEQCLEKLRFEENEKFGGEVMQSSADYLHWLSNDTGSHTLSDANHEDVIVFLKAMQQLLKINGGQEDMILQLLVDLSRERGISFPTAANGSSFQCTSQTSLHGIDDDSSMDLQALWDDIRLHLRRHLVARLQGISGSFSGHNGIQLKAQCLQWLLFLYPVSDVLAKYQHIQRNVVIELLHDYSEKNLENVLGAYQKAIPKLSSVIKEDMFVLSRVIDPSLIIKFINETFFEAITEEMKTFFEILCETTAEEPPVQPSRLNKKRHKQKVHALVIDTKDNQKKIRDPVLQLNQLKSLAMFIRMFLWLEEEVEKASSEVLFLSCSQELKGSMQGVIKADKGKITEGFPVDKGSLLRLEMPVLKFGWRKNLKELSQTLVHDFPSVIEETAASILQRDADEFLATTGSSMNLANILESYEHYGAIGEEQRPKKIAKFSFDILEEFDMLFPLAVACRGDSLQNLRTYFTEALSRIVMSILSRLEKWSIQVPDKAPLRIALVCLSSALHVLHHLTYYNEQLCKRPMFTAAVQRYQEFITNLQIQVTNYCVNVCTTSLLHDAESHNWDDNKAFYEGEHCSFSIQMWHYFCRGLRHDLWTVVSPGHAQKIFSEVVEQTLALLTYRYSQVQPNYKRASQIRIDILAILYCVEDLLWSVCRTVQELIKPTQNPKDVIFKIHSYCDSLLTVLAVYTTPLESLTKSIQNNCPEHNTHPSKPASEDLLYWLKFIHPDLFSSSKTPSAGEMAVKGQLKLLLSQPGCNWNLLLETLLHPDCLVARSLLTGSIRATEDMNLNDYEMILMEAHNPEGSNVTQSILYIFTYCSLSPHSFSNLLEEYMDQERLWDSLCNHTAHTTRNTVLRFLRRVLLRAIKGMIKEMTSLINSAEPSCYSFSDPNLHKVPDVLLKALPEKWNFRNLDGKEAKHTTKSFTRLIPDAVSVVISKLPSVIVSLPPPIKYFYSYAESKISEEYSAIKSTGLLVWNITGIICHILQDGNAIEQLTGDTLSRWNQERLAAVCACLENRVCFKDNHFTDESQKVFDDIEKRKLKWVENQLLKAKTLSYKGDFAMQEDSSTGKVQDSSFDLTEQKINMMVLDICHKASGREYLRQIHHIIRLNEVYLNQALLTQTSEHMDTCLNTLQFNLTSGEEKPSSFNPLNAFTLPVLSTLSESTTTEERWDWSSLLPHCLRVNAVTLEGLLQHRYSVTPPLANYGEMRCLMDWQPMMLSG